MFNLLVPGFASLLDRLIPYVCVCVSKIKFIKALCYAALKRFNPKRTYMLHTI